MFGILFFKLRVGTKNLKYFSLTFVGGVGQLKAVGIKPYHQGSWLGQQLKKTTGQSQVTLG